MGIWQDVRLVCRGTGQLDGLRVLTSVDDALRAGLVRVQGKVRGAAQSARYRLVDAAGAVVASGERPVDDARLDLAIDVDRVSLWWPATHGAQPMYRLQVELLDAKGAVSDAIERTIGFRRIRWLDNPGAPANAKPYLCEVNGRPLFIRGINWVPLSPFYGTVSAERYEAMLRLYRHMNVNLLRVWGGAILETDAFYEACDRLGMMVWQEFPLSSSGIENWPPEDPKVIDQLQRIAEEYVERRGHHPSHVLWCGGNELQGGLDGGKSGVGKPVDELHPLMVRWQELLAKLDPGKRFQASSPSGPTFYAHAENFGKGIHHQTHGPWGWGDVPFERLHAYWNADDSLFRSENGFPGCSSMAALERHKGDQVLWPPRDANRHWVVPTAAWIPWDDVAAAFGPIADDPGSLPTVVKAHRYLQAESYRCAAEACRRRFPTCSGYIVWMGHDCLHNTANNSVIETDGATKPGYDVLQRAYARRHVSLRHESAYCVPESLFTGSVHLHVDDVSCAGTVITSLMKLSGETVNCLTFDAADKRDMRLNWQVPACAERLFLVDVAWQYADGVAHNRYVISQQREQVLAPLLALPEAKLDVRREAPSCVVVRNSGTVAAIGVRVVCEAPSWAILTDINGVVLLPGEAQSFAYELVSLERGLVDLPHVAVECLNQRELVMV